MHPFFLFAARPVLHARRLFGPWLQCQYLAPASGRTAVAAGEFMGFHGAFHALRIHGAGIFTYIGIIWKITLGVNVGKYSSTMDPLGWDFNGFHGM